MMATMRDYERQRVDEEDACYVGQKRINDFNDETTILIALTWR
jgi:hypothetical protein